MKKPEYDLRPFIKRALECPPRVSLAGERDKLRKIYTWLRRKKIKCQIICNTIQCQGSAALDVMVLAGMSLKHYVTRDRTGKDRSYKITNDTVIFCRGHPLKKYLPLKDSVSVSIEDLQRWRRMRVQSKAIIERLGISGKSLYNAITDLEAAGISMAHGDFIEMKPSPAELDPSTEIGSYLLGVLWSGTHIGYNTRGFSISIGCKYQDTLQKVKDYFQIDAEIFRQQGGYYRLKTTKIKDGEHLVREGRYSGIDFSVPAAERKVPKVKFRFVEFLQGYAEMHGWSGEYYNRRQDTSTYFFQLIGARELLEFISKKLHVLTGCRPRKRFFAKGKMPVVRWESEDSAKIIPFLDTSLPHSEEFRKELHKNHENNKYLNKQTPAR